MLLKIVKLISVICFPVLSKFSLLVLLDLVLAFFAAKLMCYTNLYLVILLFSCIFLQLCSLALLIRSYGSLLQPLTTKNYAYFSLCLVFWQAQS